jgi:MFS transporter, NNP family, nitrate/nitrite transporter
MFLPQIGVDGQASGGSWPGFFAMFLLLFTCAGLGNGSTYKMIPTIFSTLCQSEAKDSDEATQKAARLRGLQESAAAAGFISAIGAYGGFFIPQSFGLSIKASGGPELALYTFIAFYISCVWITWHYYAKPRADLPC